MTPQTPGKKRPSFQSPTTLVSCANRMSLDFCRAVDYYSGLLCVSTRRRLGKRPYSQAVLKLLQQRLVLEMCRAIFIEGNCQKKSWTNDATKNKKEGYFGLISIFKLFTFFSYY